MHRGEERTDGAAVFNGVPAGFVQTLAQVAVRILPEPVNAAAAQPAIEVAPSLKFAVPVGAVPLTVAVKVTLVPAVEGVNELPIPVVLVAPLTVWESAALLDVAFAASPL